MGGVSPIIETSPAPAVAGQQQVPVAPVAAQAPTSQQGAAAPPAQAPVQQGGPETQQQPAAAPTAIQGLPSTSTGPVNGTGTLALISAFGAYLWRRMRR
jgi:hypothetical protein